MKHKELYRNMLMLIVSIMAFFTHASICEAQQNYKPSDTYVISTYPESYNWSERIIKHIEKLMGEEQNAAPVVMHMPIIEVKTMDELNVSMEQLHQNLDKKKPKSIILLGSSAMALCEDINKWYPGISMMIIAGQTYSGNKEAVIARGKITYENRLTIKDLQQKYNITMQCLPVFIPQELNLIRQLVPQLTTLYYVGGEDHFSRSKETEIKEDIMRNHMDIKFVTLSPKTTSLDKLITTLDKLNPKTDAVIYSSWIGAEMDKNTPLVMSRSAYIIGTSSAPIFSLRDNGWMEESGKLLGGCFLNDEEAYKSFGEAIIKLINGTPAKEIEDYDGGEPIVKINYKRMKALGIDSKLCPDGTIFIDKPPTLWQSYGQEIIVVAFIIIVVLLLLSYHAMKQSEKARKAQQRELEQTRLAKQILEREDNEKHEFFRHITHEIRTPLNAVVGFSQLLTLPDAQELYSREDQVEMQQGIMANTTTMLNLVGNMMRFSDLLSGSLQVNVTDCKINEIGEYSIERVRTLVPHDVKIKFESSVDDNFKVHSCRSCINEVLFNMLTNACKFTQKGTIVLRFSKGKEDNSYQFSCTDTGCGVPKDKAEYIFERYTQIDTFTQGLGIGLTMSRGVAGLLKGELYLDTNYSSGARFIFKFKELV